MPTSSRCPGPLLTAIREAITERATWQETAELVGAQLRQQLPGPEILTASERRGDPGNYQAHALHVERDGSFSVVGLVWRPGQRTLIHDHVAWGAFAVLEGAEYEETFALSPDGRGLVPLATRYNGPGDVSAFAPPGDIHRIVNEGDQTVIQLHVYGTDVARLGTSIRRIYDLPVLDLRP